MSFVRSKYSESVSAFNKLKESMQILREFSIGNFFLDEDNLLCTVTRYYYGFFQKDDALFLYKINSGSEKRLVSSLKMYKDGRIEEFKDEWFLDFKNRSLSSLSSRLLDLNRQLKLYGIFSFNGLPVIGYFVAIEEKCVRFSFLNIPGYFTNKVILGDIGISTPDDYSVCDFSIATCKTYFAVTLALTSLNLRCKNQRKLCKPREKELLLILFQIKKDFTNGELAKELWRHNIQDFVPKGGVVRESVFDHHENIILLHISFANRRSHHFLIYSIKCKNITRTLKLNQTRKKISQIYFLHHPTFKEGLIVTLGKQKKIIYANVYAVNRNQRLKIFKKLGNSHTKHTFIKNRGNQILAIHTKRDGETLFIQNLFDKSNATIIPCARPIILDLCGCTLFATRINWNETGEEIYIWDNLKLRVFANKACVPTLVSLCEFAVCKTFSRHQLKKLHFPKHLEK